ncbi:hypothetical protein BD289DRAFT_452551 [Coniella lustricola]|uniref:Uncharacterized protein n=1 Tax=Coniella lustricola TaxID=2025994 RepID=A0A2T3AAX8_9PEZI|nr:hypothetical protein BD289DRAFT_452551 [Coniella lustricola]
MSLESSSRCGEGSRLVEPLLADEPGWIQQRPTSIGQDLNGGRGHTDFALAIRMDSGCLESSNQPYSTPACSGSIRISGSFMHALADQPPEFCFSTLEWFEAEALWDGNAPAADRLKAWRKLGAFDALQKLLYTSYPQKKNPIVQPLWSPSGIRHLQAGGELAGSGH